jgi:hypothetical protein
MRTVLREGCRDGNLDLPKTGEDIVFEPGDAVNITERTTVRVLAAEGRPHDFGNVSIHGWKIGSHGFPEPAEILYVVSTATLDARRETRRRQR